MERLPDWSGKPAAGGLKRKAGTAARKYSMDDSYFKNFSNTFSEPHNTNLSLKIIYYLDYLDFKKEEEKGIMGFQL